MRLADEYGNFARQRKKGDSSMPFNQLRMDPGLWAKLVSPSLLDQWVMCCFAIENRAVMAFGGADLPESPNRRSNRLSGKGELGMLSKTGQPLRLLKRFFPLAISTCMSRRRPVSRLGC
jgi:hypothetical protein